MKPPARMTWGAVGVLLASVAGLIVAGIAPTPALAACLAPKPDQPPPALSDAWCVTAALEPDQQVQFNWPSQSLALGTLTFGTLPGQLGNLSLVSRPDGREIWKGTVTGEGVAESRPLLLLPGDYGLVITAGPTPLVYRAELARAELPGELPTSLEGEFEGLLRGTGAEIVVPWTVPQPAQPGLWTLEVKAPAGSAMTATLRGGGGSSIFYTAAADSAGTFRLPDLDLPPGSYSLSLYAPPAGIPLIAAARLEPRPAAFATEPDDLPEQAHPLELDAPLKGRLASGGTGAEADYFALTVPPGDPRMYDITVAAASDQPLGLALTDDTGRYRASRDGAGGVALRNLVLPSGRHLLRVSGILPPEGTYTLLARETGVPAAGQEAEPNNEAVDANIVPQSAQMTGTFEGTDSEYLILGVAGPLQLWDIEASGEGAYRLALYDAAERLIAATSVRSGGVLRLDRMLLPRGANVVRLEGSDGSWLLRANPAGDLVEGEEYEANDEASRALPLPLGEKQTGWLQRADDSDVYTFHLSAWQRVALSVSGPSGVPVRLMVSWGEQGNRIAEAVGLPAGPGEAGLVWQALLPPGDFLVDLRAAEGRSREPYTILLESPSYFDRPLDLEPNDEVWQAGSSPPAYDLVEGSLGGVGADWFPLVPLEATGPLVVRAEQLPGSVEVSLAYGDAKAPQMGEAFYLYQDGEEAQFNPPAGAPLYLGVRGNVGHYRLSLGRPAQDRPELPLEAELSFEPARIAAFAEPGQRLEGTLTLRSAATAPMQVDTRVWLSDEQWRLEQLPGTLDVPPAGTMEIPVSIEVPSDVGDDAPVLVDIELRQGEAVPVLARAVVEVRTDAPVVGAHPGEPIPATLRGGLNVASIVFGASASRAAAGLFDDVIDLTGVTLDLNQPADVTLAANGQPAPIAGVILQPARGGLPSDRLSDFAIEVSRDGVAFERVIETALSPATRDQAFAFPQPIAAKALRLIPLAAAGGPNIPRARLAELQAIAAPGYVLDPAGFDIAAPALGGHIVRSIGLGDQPLTGEGALWPVYPVQFEVTPNSDPPEWVFGFRHGRAAQLSSIVWHARQDVVPEENIRRIAIAASTVGPLGPWVDVGSYELGTGAGPQPLALPSPVWARSLRFTVVEPTTGRAAMPARIEVREALGPSILGAWPDLSRSGPFEIEAAGEPATASTSSISHDPLLPTQLPLETHTRGQVRRGAVEDWYAIEVPEGTRGVTARFDGGVAPAVALTLVGEDGAETAFERDSSDPATLFATAAPGRWRIKVTQPVASVAITWDTSGSVGALGPAIERMIRRLSWNLDPEREVINLLPFRGETSEFLMPKWSGDRADVFAALLAYPFKDSSSDAESAMLVAARELSARPGQRAIVIVTDASFSGTARNEELWRYLAAGQIEVFSLYLPVDYDPARTRAQTNLMSDWASAAGGHVSRFASQADSETAYRRVAGWLNRPASYAFSVTAETAPLAPGSLVVQLGMAEASGGASPAGGTPLAVSVILDASGSMLQRIGDERRIDIAKQVLRELGEDVLPEGLPVSLRVFGHDKPGSCESELFLPLTPLDRATFAAAVDRVQSVNLARTSIAASLRAVTGDLAASDGSKIVVLITDGEETCEGDPLAEINRLREQGVDVRVNIVGFAIDDPALRQTFEEWAAAGEGAYFDAGNSEALGAAVKGATSLSYTVVDEGGAEVGRGVAGKTIELPPGRYTIRFGGRIPDKDVTIRPHEAETVLIGPS